MKVNLLLKTLLAASALCLGTSAFALPTVKLTLNSPYFGVPDQLGGEFVAHSSANGTFLTFCLEKHVNVDMGVQYYYTVNDGAQLGGPGAVLGSDPISNGTAWLYNAFLKHTLVDTDGVGLYGDNPNHAYNAGILQLAIWMLEDEITWDSSNYYISLLGSQAWAKADYTGKDVKAMNLWTNANGTGDVQSVLIHVPDGATTSVLLGLGLISLALFRRRS